MLFPFSKHLLLNPRHDLDGTKLEAVTSYDPPQVVSVS